jgi:hypothetical protein
LIEQARDSVVQGKINAFDQQRINSFLRSGSRTSKASDRPLAHKLKEGTYRKYKKTWKQLLCLVFRMVYLESLVARSTLLVLLSCTEHASIAGCHIEDQVLPKRCGQLNGKDVVTSVLRTDLER